MTKGNDNLTNPEPLHSKRHLARFFVENRAIAWMLLVVTVLWGIFGYRSMPQRRDPDIPVKEAMVIYPWPGVEPQKIEDLITRKIEEKISGNVNVTRIKSHIRTGVSTITFELSEDLGKEAVDRALDDVKIRLDSIHDLPAGSGPLVYLKDFGDTATLMLAVASPKVSEVRLSILGRDLRAAIKKIRATRITAPLQHQHYSLIAIFPSSVDQAAVVSETKNFIILPRVQELLVNAVTFHGSGFVGIDFYSPLQEKELKSRLNPILQELLHRSELHPDATLPFLVLDESKIESQIQQAASDQYSYRELNDFSDLIRRELQKLDEVSRVDRYGNLEERFYLTYSQALLASSGITPSHLIQSLALRNRSESAGHTDVLGQRITLALNSELTSKSDLAKMTIGNISNGTLLYLRDLFDVSRQYESPPQYLNYLHWKDSNGSWQRSRSVTLSVQMRPGKRIEEFAKAVEKSLTSLKQRLPEDLIYTHTSDQPAQVKENTELFNRSLYEAIALVILIAFIGFWEWRSAALLSASIPLTLLMTYGMIQPLGIDLQQVSIASFIIALGLLVDDPVVANDAIQREMEAGWSPAEASWRGPVRLGKAILFATITNIAAYLPLLTIRGKVGQFLYSLPVVMTCALIASRIVSMTFIPLIASYLFKPVKPVKPGKSDQGNLDQVPVNGVDSAQNGYNYRNEQEIEERLAKRRSSGLTGHYYRIVQKAMVHRGITLALSLFFVVGGAICALSLKSDFFPKDLSYLSYVDIWLPENASIVDTSETAKEAEEIIHSAIQEFSKKESYSDLLRSVSVFVGGSSPRFWFSLNPEPRQENYAQIIVELNHKNATPRFVRFLQSKLAAQLSGARADVRELETGPPIGVPVTLRISGDDRTILRSYANQLKDILAKNPLADRIHDDWGVDRFAMSLETDPDRLALAHLSEADVLISMNAASKGIPVSMIRDRDQQIPVMMRLRMNERSELTDLENAYIFPSMESRGSPIPLRNVAQFHYDLAPQTLRRRDQFRTIEVSAFPIEGALPSQVLRESRQRIDELSKSLLPGYKLEYGGEYEEQIKAFRQISVALVISVTLIFAALVIQFNHLVKPWIVFSAIPFGIAGAFFALWITQSSFGFMAFLGVASLIGVIVSHVIVLFDYIEEEHHAGRPFFQAVLDAGIQRIRPIFITIGATVLALFPLALHGGPLWRPLCFAQIGGLTVAAVVTLVMVPVIYAIFVVDLKWIEWVEMAPVVHAEVHPGLRRDLTSEEQQSDVEPKL